jgi:hypothetical protein
MEQTLTLNVGDTVRLNSGSRDWKVISLRGEDCTVEWHYEGVRYEHALPQVCVYRVS